MHLKSFPIKFLIFFLLISCEKNDTVAPLDEDKINQMIEAKAQELLRATLETQKKEEEEKIKKEKRIELAAENHAIEILRQKELAEEKAEIEVLRIAEEKALLEEIAEAKREEIAADLASREAKREADRLVRLELAATEKARRLTVIAEAKNFVDSINFSLTGVGDTLRVSINGEPSPDGKVIVSPSGYSVKYLGKEGDYFKFQYADDALEVNLKRTLRGLTLADVIQKKPLAEGIPSESFANKIPGSSYSRGFAILKATYGALSTHKDVKELVKGKINNGKLNLYAGSGGLGGDPIFGEVKEFRIKYLHNGRIKEKVYREGERVSLP